jgi:6-phosphofructokinase 2
MKAIKAVKTKKIIITVTFSPCIDKSVSIKKMIPESKLKCFDIESYPGGGGINVARVLTRFECDVTAFFPVHRNKISIFESSLNDEKVHYATIPTDHETRENIEVLDLSSNKQYRLVMPNNELSEEEWKICLLKIKQFKKIDILVISGSMPLNCPATIFQELSKIAIAKKAKLIIDTSGKALKNAITEPIFLIKPNLEEFGVLIGKDNLTKSNLRNNAKKFMSEHKCENLVVSLGSKGAMLFNKSVVFDSKPPKVKIKSTVGAGDSMLAGIVYGLDNDLNLKECLNLGVALGTATTMKQGTELCSKEDVDMLLPKVINMNL